MKKILLVCFLSLGVASAWANVRLPKIFGDSMVLQRDRPIPVWGWADKNETVTIQFHNQKKTTKADAQGKWHLTLSPETAGGPYSLIAKGKNSITYKEILVGDVWICSGQSNMEWPVVASNNAAQEISSASYPQIRHFKVVNDVGEQPKKDLAKETSWKAATPANVGSFTAVGYFFGRELHNQLGVPIGLLNTSWGGTEVETWTSREAFENSEEFKQMIAAVPVINMDSIAKQRSRAILQTVQTVQGGLPDASTLIKWSTASFDDSKWPQMDLPALWETGALKDVDGVVWLRKTIEVKPENAGKPAELHLATIDDNDEAYVNGAKIGATKGYNIKRIYTIPAGVLKAGKNSIAVRVEDTGGGGGIYGEANDLKLVVGGEAQSLAGPWSYAVASLITGNSFTNPNSFPTLLYNAMVNPLIPFAIKGVIWYQGESNAGRAYQYRTAFPLMINDWRSRWKQGDFPFYFVQLASFDAGGGNSDKGSNWAELREAQTLTLSLPNTGMAVTTDIGESKDIHPRNKQDVGKRLAAIALHDAYGKDVVYSGPVFNEMKIEGNKVVLSFSHVESGLMTKDKYGYLKGFEIAGADQKFHYAKAFIEGDKVVVYQEAVSSPVAVRYAWADDAGEANLFNKEGFPAVPFRTDKWKGITEKVKYRQ